jgi:hypothetical protein
MSMNVEEALMDKREDPVVSHGTVVPTENYDPEIERIINVWTSVGENRVSKSPLCKLLSSLENGV